MKTTLVIGDIHCRHGIVKNILNSWDGPIIQIGDWFDNFGEKPKETIATAELLKEFVHRPDTITLMGNHDIQYRVLDKNALYCSGYEPQKYDLINDILNEEDWCKLKYFHYEQNYWFSHAGISRDWFQHPIHGITPKVILDKVDKAEQALKAKLYSDIKCLYAADFYRGGRYRKGGLLWNDWANIEEHDGITEIVGHTPSKIIRMIERENSRSINVDSFLNELLIIHENGKLEIIKTRDLIYDKYA